MVKRSFVLLMEVVFFISILYNISLQVYAVDCCVAPEGCFSSDDYGGEDFQENCNDLGGTVYGGLCENIAGNPCVIVCCCPTALNPTAPPLKVTHDYCSELSATDQYQEKTLQSEKTCEAVCGTPSGGGEPQAGYTISGVVKNNLGQPLGSASVTAKYGSQTKSTVTGSSGAYSISGLPQGDINVTATRSDCNPLTQNVVIENKDVQKDFTLNCLEGCQPSPPNKITAKWVKESDEAQITIDTTNLCPGWIKFIINRYKKTSEGNFVFLSSIESTETTFIDKGLSSGTVYCYNASIKYPSGILGMENGNMACLPVADEECIHPTHETPEFCFENMKARCDDNNKLITEDCGVNLCFVTADGKAMCKQPAACNLCNGLFGLFGKLNLKVQYEGVLQTCQYLQQNKLCVYDRPPEGIVVEKYRGCGEVVSCIDYRSLNACEDNFCRVSSDTEACSWYYGERQLGKGVCSSEDEIRCEMCEAINGYCTKELCEQISKNQDGTSNCYFRENIQDIPGLSSRCISREKMGCRFYITQQECLGNSAGVRVDISYDSENLPTGGTNNILSASADLFSFKVCDWNSVENKCYKNADNWKPQGVSPDDDCFTGQIPREELGECAKGEDACLKCLGDNTPPQTTLNINSTKTYTTEDLPFLPYSVEDDTYGAEDIKTFFCAVKKGQQCYPNKTISNLVVSEGGTYTIFYYSTDQARNFEVVKSKDISVVLGTTPKLVNIEAK